MFRLPSSLSSPRGSLDGFSAPPPLASPAFSSEGPQAAFSLDDSLDELSLIVRYSASSLPLQRLVFLKRLTSASRQFGFSSAFAALLPVFRRLAGDGEAVIRQALAAEIANMALYLFDPRENSSTSSSPSFSCFPCPSVIFSDGEDFIENLEEIPTLDEKAARLVATSPLRRLVRPDEPAEFSHPISFSSSRRFGAAQEGGRLSDFLSDQMKEEEGPTITMSCWEAAYWSIINELIPILTVFLLDSNAEVRQAACEAFVKTARCLTEEDIGKNILTPVLNLAHSEPDEDRTTAVGLLHELAPLLGFELCKSFVCMELASLADDATFRVRKATAQCFGNVCETLGSELSASKLLPSFIRLSKDSIWGVRKGCVDSLVAVARSSSTEVRHSQIIPLFEKFSKDTSKWVRNAAYEILGPFLHALGRDLCSPDLVVQFSGIPTLSSAVVDSEVNFYCAHSLPAVALTIGPERFEAEILPCLNKLAKDVKPSVRRVIACAFPVLAELSGLDICERSLFPLFDYFLRDVDEVKFAAVRQLSLFLRFLGPGKREEMLEQLWIIQKIKEKWRFRMVLARQMPHFIKLFQPDIVSSGLTPILLALLKDPVNAVRTTAARAVGCLIENLRVSDSVLLEPALLEFQNFALSPFHFDRQLFAGLARTVEKKDKKIFEEKFGPLIKKLSEDKVDNVRLALASVVIEISSRSPAASAALETLKGDKNEEVRKIANKENRQEQENPTNRQEEEKLMKDQPKEESLCDNPPAPLVAVENDETPGVPSEAEVLLEQLDEAAPMEENQENSAATVENAHTAMELEENSQAVENHQPLENSGEFDGRDEEAAIAMALEDSANLPALLTSELAIPAGE